MKIVQAVPGSFHHFDVAVELHRRGLLEAIFSSFPWFRLKREGLPRDKVYSYARLDLLLRALERAHMTAPMPVKYRLMLLDHTAFDRWMRKRVPPCDVFFALSGVALRTGMRVQQRGGLYICDRGSAHIRVQADILREEYKRWHVNGTEVHAESIRREEAEYQQADAITVPSTFARNSFLAMGTSPEKLIQIPYGVRLDRFYPEGKPETGSFDILYAGQVSFQKGIPYLLEAFRRFRHPRKRLRIAGVVPKEMQGFLHGQDLRGVEFLGPLPQPALRRWMSVSRCFVLPSVQDGFGMVMGQAMACRCPVIATTNTGGMDLVREGVEGFVVAARSPEAIADKLQWIADNPHAEVAMREAAARRVASLGGWGDYVDRFVAEMQRRMDARN